MLRAASASAERRYFQTSTDCRARGSSARLDAVRHVTERSVRQRRPRRRSGPDPCDRGRRRRRGRQQPADADEVGRHLPRARPAGVRTDPHPRKPRAPPDVVRHRAARAHRRGRRGAQREPRHGRDRLAVDQPGRRGPDRGEDLLRAHRPADLAPQRGRAARARRLHEQPAAPWLGRPEEEPAARCRARLGAAQGDREGHRRARDAEDLRPRARSGDGQRDAGVLSRDRRRDQGAWLEADRPGDASGRRVLGATRGTGRRGGRLRGRAQGLGGVVAGPHRRRSASAAARLGELAGRPLRRSAGRRRRSRKLGAVARAVDPRWHARLARRSRRGANPGRRRGRHRADEPAAPTQRRRDLSRRVRRAAARHRLRRLHHARRRRLRADDAPASRSASRIRSRPRAA